MRKSNPTVKIRGFQPLEVRNPESSSKLIPIIACPKSRKDKIDKRQPITKGKNPTSGEFRLPIGNFLDSNKVAMPRDNEIKPKIKSLIFIFNVLFYLLICASASPFLKI